jgi:hypothetical protein
MSICTNATLYMSCCVPHNSAVMLYLLLHYTIFFIKMFFNYFFLMHLLANVFPFSCVCDFYKFVKLYWSAPLSRNLKMQHFSHSNLDLSSPNPASLLSANSSSLRLTFDHPPKCKRILHICTFVAMQVELMLPFKSLLLTVIKTHHTHRTCNSFDKHSLPFPWK